ncbi:hypothetical protein M078_0987 [Bacteroides fragilis str. 2-F-2 |nr:hypothetical protein M078_0987 [Bacteroides fragilis str. 2-F-2 \
MSIISMTTVFLIYIKRTLNHYINSQKESTGCRNRLSEYI